MKAKIANAEQMKVHPPDAGLVIGNRDMKANAVSSEFTAKTTLRAKPRGEVFADVL